MYLQKGIFRDKMKNPYHQNDSCEHNRIQYDLSNGVHQGILFIA